MADDTLIVIPARFASTRLPGKPLLSQSGKPLIRYSWESVSQVAPTVVATDDRRILDVVEAFGGEAVMTSPEHPSGTDRVAEVAAGSPSPFVINVQGDEPDLDPEDLLAVIELLRQGASMATLVVASSSREAWNDTNRVKVAVGRNGEALYFSRSGIPFCREASGRPASFWLHIGVYGYRRDVLLALSRTEPSPLERTEKLEQLRALESGYKISVAVARRAPTGIDTPEDYHRFCQRAGQEGRPT